MHSLTAEAKASRCGPPAKTFSLHAKRSSRYSRIARLGFPCMQTVHTNKIEKGEKKERTGAILGVKLHAADLMRVVKKDFCLIKRILSICANCPIIRYGGCKATNYNE
jgi:hypothetical protein